MLLPFLLAGCNSSQPPADDSPLRLLDTPVLAHDGGAYGLLSDGRTAVVLHPDGYTTMLLGSPVALPERALDGVVYPGRDVLYVWSEEYGLRRFETPGTVLDVIDQGDSALVTIEATTGVEFWVLTPAGMHPLPNRRQ
jgi:hypothetical protein